MSEAKEVAAELRDWPGDGHELRHRAAALIERLNAALGDEREGCARLVENHGHSNGKIRASHKHLAAAIRARSTNV